MLQLLKTKNLLLPLVESHVSHLLLMNKFSNQLTASEIDAEYYTPDTGALLDLLGLTDEQDEITEKLYELVESMGREKTREIAQAITN